MSYLESMLQENNKKIQELQKKVNYKIKPTKKSQNSPKVRKKTGGHVEYHPGIENTLEVNQKTLATLIKDTDGTLALLFRENNTEVKSKIIRLTLADNTLLRFL